jgi:hypothetical protein
LNEFEGEILENERGIDVPMITKNIEIENSVKKAFEHIMKTKIGQDETIPDDLLQMIHKSLTTEQNGRNIEIPLYDQLHQANVCVICDRFITGTADLNRIKNNTLIQHKARLTIPDINSELQKCTKFQILICMNYYYHQEQDLKRMGNTCVAHNVRELCKMIGWTKIHQNMQLLIILQLVHYLNNYLGY